MQAENWEYVSAAFDIRTGDPDALWQLILAIHARNDSEDVRCVLSAGPLEDLLVKHGEAFIERVEQQAYRDQAFASLLRGVYRRSMNGDVWRRVMNIANGSRRGELH